MDLNETARWVEDLKTGANLADRMLLALDADPLNNTLEEGLTGQPYGLGLELNVEERAYIARRQAAGWAPRP